MVINLSVKCNVYEEKGEGQRGGLFSFFFLLWSGVERRRERERVCTAVCMEMETEVVRFECRLRK